MGEEELRREIIFALKEHNWGWIINILKEELEKYAEMCWDEMEVEILGKSGITASILEQIAISRLAQKRYGLKISPQGLTNCPFHDDEHPSLKFYDNQGRFHCFGCNADGNTIEFVKMMEKWRKKSKKQ